MEEIFRKILERDYSYLTKAISSGADPNVVDEHDVPAVFACVALGDEKALRIFLEAGAAYPDPVRGFSFERYLEGDKILLERWFDALELSVAVRNIEVMKMLAPLAGGGVYEHGDIRVSIWDEIGLAAYDGDYRYAQIFCLNQAQKVSPGIFEDSSLRQCVFEFIPKIMSDFTNSNGHFKELIFKRENEKSSVRGDSSNVRKIRFGLSEPAALVTFWKEGMTSESSYRDGELEYHSESTTVLKSQLSEKLYLEMTQTGFYPDDDHDRSFRIGGSLFFSQSENDLSTFIASRPSADVQVDFLHAIDYDQEEVARKALVSGADSYLDCNGGDPADILAASYGSANVMRVLLEEDEGTLDRLLNPDIREWSALCTAIFAMENFDRFYLESRPVSHEQIVLDLISFGADVNFADRAGESPLVHACKSEGKISTVLALLAAGGDCREALSSLKDCEKVDGEALAVLQSWQARDAVKNLLKMRMSAPQLG